MSWIQNLDEREGNGSTEYNIRAVHFTGFVYADNGDRPIEKFAEQVPDGARWVMKFKDNSEGILQATYKRDTGDVCALYCARGLALIPK